MLLNSQPKHQKAVVCGSKSSTHPHTALGQGVQATRSCGLPAWRVEGRPCAGEAGAAALGAPPSPRNLGGHRGKDGLNRETISKLTTHSSVSQTCLCF